MSRYVITQKNKKEKGSKITKERVEIKIIPLIVCVVLAFCFWLYVAGNDAKNEQKGMNPPSDNTRIEGETDDALSEINKPATQSEEIGTAPTDNTEPMLNEKTTGSAL